MVKQIFMIETCVFIRAFGRQPPTTSPFITLVFFFFNQSSSREVPVVPNEVDYTVNLIDIRPCATCNKFGYLARVTATSEPFMFTTFYCAKNRLVYATSASNVGGK